MAAKALDPEDPFELVGVTFGAQGEEELKDMALSFAEEFVREGFDAERLINLFRNPFYQGPYLVWKQKGDVFVRSVIEEAVRMWRPRGEKKA